MPELWNIKTTACYKQTRISRIWLDLEAEFALSAGRFSSIFTYTVLIIYLFWQFLLIWPCKTLFKFLNQTILIFRWFNSRSSFRLSPDPPVEEAQASHQPILRTRSSTMSKKVETYLTVTNGHLLDTVRSRSYSCDTKKVTNRVLPIIKNPITQYPIPITAKSYENHQIVTQNVR